MLVVVWWKSGRAVVVVSVAGTRSVRVGGHRKSVGIAGACVECVVREDTTAIK